MDSVNDTSLPALPWMVEENFRRLPESFYTHLPPEGVGEQPALLHANVKAADLVDLPASAFDDPDFVRMLSGHAPVPGFAPLAMVYAGHQFGGWVPRLGDGRALLVAQIRNRHGALWDVQLKGAGRTPYSRFGDGRAVLRSSIREYLCSEAMAALGIPTTRALALITTNEPVQRETLEPGAVLTRLAPSHVRFGHFEYFHHSGRHDEVRMLADHVIDEHFREISRAEDRYESWFREIVRRTGRLIAEWQAVGFAHGVMNTDNMSILGLTIDYGPFGFLDSYDPGFICNHSDDSGRYAFARQPAIGLWNLQALAMALTSLVPVEALRDALGGFETAFTSRFGAIMQAKLGLADEQPGDAQLRADLLAVMAGGEADYTLVFRTLALSDTKEGRAAWLALFTADARAAAGDWLDRYQARVARLDPTARIAAMNAVNPKYVLRNWVAESTIRAVEDRGDIGSLDRVLRLLQSPFAEHPGESAFAAPPPDSMRQLSVSCSS